MRMRRAGQHAITTFLHFFQHFFSIFNGSIFRLAFSCLNSIFSHGQRPIDTMQFVVKATSIADGFTFVVSPP